MPGCNIYRADLLFFCKVEGVCISYKFTLPLRVLNFSNLNECIQIKCRAKF